GRLSIGHSTGRYTRSPRQGSSGRTGGWVLRDEVTQPLGQELYPSVQSPLHRPGGDPEHRRGLGLREPLDVHQVEYLTFIIRQSADCFEDEAGGRGEAGVAVGRSRNNPVAQFYGGGLCIQSSGDVIELPPQVLTGQGEELADGRGACLTQ